MGGVLGSVAGHVQQPRGSEEVKKVQGRHWWLMTETLAVKTGG